MCRTASASSNRSQGGGGESMEKTTNVSLRSRFRFRCVLITAALLLWWALVMVHFSVDSPRAPPMHSPLGRPFLSSHGGSALHSEHLADENYESYTRKEETLTLASNRQTQDVETEAINAQEEQGGSISPVILNSMETLSVEKLTPDLQRPEEVEDPCAGRHIYVHELNPYFNENLLKQCAKLNVWQDLCPMVRNAGLGQKLNNTDGVFSDTDWYTTNQFTLEAIFHNRMKQYKCLTMDSSRAAAVFVPFYAGFEIAMNLWGANITVRDKAPSRLYEWLTRQAEWKRFHGHDHFLVGGRITWDFRRRTDEEEDWGNKLFVLPAGLNMTLLTIEASPWHDNDVAIPYPTYFHPSSKTSMEEWQERMRTMERSALFSFVGAPRPGLSTSIRGKIMDQCLNSRHCKLLNCNDDDNRVCHQPHKVMEVFEHSIFCLQPQGDSYTRRSIFDSMLAGCIPVFFHYYSAYSQYVWHLPSDHSSYSVLIEEEGIQNDSTQIEKVLRGYAPEQINSMREAVIQAIPGIVYADPRTDPLEDIKDAFDISVQGVIDCASEWKRRTQNGTVEGAIVDSLEVQDIAGEAMANAHVAAEEAMKQSERATTSRESISVKRT